MRSLWPQLGAWLDAGTPFALATVVATEGSAPRRPGAVMALDPAATRFLGSVSSGCLESEVLEAARLALAEGRARTLRFGPNGSVPWSHGLTCGGFVTVRVEPWWGLREAPGQVDLAAAVVRWIEEETAAVVLTWGERHLGVTVSTQVGKAEGWPPELVLAAREWLAVGGPSGAAEWGGETVFFRSLRLRRRLVLIGAVEVAARLVELAAAADWRVAVVDPRAAYRHPERFSRRPEEMFSGWPQDLIPGLALGPGDAAIALSHDPKIDDPALVALLASNVGYVGAMGSRRSHAERLERLRAMGVEATDLSRLRGPAGLTLGAPDAMGIATGMLAGLVQWAAEQDRCAEASFAPPFVPERG